MEIPASDRDIANVLSATGATNGLVYGLHFYANAIYNPATQGAITNLIHSEDNRRIAGPTNGQITGIALRQSTNFYYRAIGVASSTNWTFQSATVSVASSFSLITGQQPNGLDNTQNPNFSTNAPAPIQFGFARVQSGSSGNGGSTNFGGIDNWRLVVGHSGPPDILVQPTNRVVIPGAVTNFSVTATTLTGSLTYQWRRNCRNIAGATNATLTITNAGPSDVGEYSVTVANAFGSITSSDATLRLNPDAPITLIQSVSPTNLTLSWPRRPGPNHLEATTNFGVPPFNWTTVTDAVVRSTGTNRTNQVVLTGAKKFFRVASSSVQIINQPLGGCASLGDTVLLSVTATGATALSYQWLLNGVSVTGATNSTLLVGLTNNANFGAFQVYVEDTNGAVKSRAAVLRPCGVDTVLADNFASATVFTNASGSLHGRTFGATQEAGETNHTGVPGGKSVWMRWEPTASGIATFDTKGSGFDTLLVAGTGTNVTAFTPEAADDDAGSNACSRIQFNALAGTVYRIQLDGMAASEGFYVLNWILRIGSETVPVIDVQPRDTIILPTASTNFSVTAHGVSPFTNLTYQWYFNGNALTNQTNSSLAVGPSPVLATNVGVYNVRVSNGVFAVFSRDALLQNSTNTPFTNGFRFVRKPTVDTICGFNPADGCCSEIFVTSSGKDPKDVLAPGAGAITGSYMQGPSSPFDVCEKRSYWTWVTNTFSSSIDVTVTGEANNATTGISIRSTLAVFDAAFNRVACEKQTGKSVVLIKQPAINRTYYFVLGYDQEDAKCTVTYRQP